MESDPNSGLPPYTYVPGGPWPHPNRSKEAEGTRQRQPPADAADPGLFRRGVELFDAGYYWEAHEAWEVLWHAAGRRGATADILRGLIKLAAAGIKVRERREPGVLTHARRAAECFASARRQGGAHQLGLDLDQWIERALAIAESPPTDPGPPDAPVTRVFGFRFEQRSVASGQSSDVGSRRDEHGSLP